MKQNFMKELFSLYFKELDKKRISVIVLIAISLICFEGVFNWIIQNLVIDFFQLNNLKSNTRIDIYFTLLFVISISYLVYLLFIRKIYPTINSLLSGIVLFISYLFLFKWNSFLYLLQFQYINIPYSDVIFFSFVILTFRFKRFYKPFNHNGHLGLKEDTFNVENDIDIYERENYAIRILEKIIYTGNKKAFVIAINGLWGQGKTVFISFLIKHIKVNYDVFINSLEGVKKTELSEIEVAQIKDVKKNILEFEFNPWKNFDNRKLIREFFMLFSNKLSEYDISLSKSLKDYSSQLTELNDSDLSKLIQQSFEYFIPSQSLSDSYDEINASLELLGKKIVIIIDDLDRLTGEELIDVLRLVRNTANFANTFFVLAYDHNYVLNAIERKNKISNKEDFLHKLVQLELTLPVIGKNVLLEYTKKQLSKLTPDKTKVLELTECISGLQYIPVRRDDIDYSKDSFIEADPDFNLFNGLIRSVRDAHRFLNSFKISFEAIGDFCDLQDLLILELLKSRFLSIYQLVSQKKYIMKKSSELSFNKESFLSVFNQNQCDYYNIKHSEMNIIEGALDCLFNVRRKRYFRSIIYPEYFSYYFKYDSFRLTVLEKFEEAYKNGLDAVIDFIKRTDDEGDIDDLKTILLSRVDFKNAKDFELSLQILFYLANYDQYTVQNKIKDLLSMQDLFKDFYPNKKTLESFILKTLKNRRFDIKTRVEIAHDNLYAIINNSVDNKRLLVARKIPLQNVLFQHLQEWLEGKTDVDEYMFHILIRNLQSIEEGTRKINLTKKAASEFGKFVLSHRNVYLRKYFIRHYSIEGRGGFVFDPFLKDCIGGWSKVKSFIFSSKSKQLLESTDDERKFYEILKKGYKIFELNRYKYFTLTSEEEIKIVEDMLAS